MHRAFCPPIRESLHQIADVDQARPRHRRRRRELPGVEGVNLQTTNIILKEQRAQPEVRVRADSAMSWPLELSARYARVVKEA